MGLALQSFLKDKLTKEQKIAFIGTFLIIKLSGISHIGLFHDPFSKESELFLL